MKRNNKGFMLVEVIITSTIVVTSMIALYTSFNRLYNNYRTRSNYYNLDTTYATKEMVNTIFASQNETRNINFFINNTFYNSEYGYLIKNAECSEEITLSSCETIKNLYKVENMIFVEYDLNSLNTLKSNVSNQTFKDYIDYLINYYDIRTKNNNVETEYNYIILTETMAEDNYYYANLRMR